MDDKKRTHGIGDAAELAEKMMDKVAKLTFVWGEFGRPHATEDDPGRTAFVKTLCDEEVKAERSSDNVPSDLCGGCRDAMGKMNLVEG
jgi:hypothetical protein